MTGPMTGPVTGPMRTSGDGGVVGCRDGGDNPTPETPGSPIEIRARAVHDRGMEILTRRLAEVLLDPVVIVAAVVLSAALLSGFVARVVQAVEALRPVRSPVQGAGADASRGQTGRAVAGAAPSNSARLPRRPRLDRPRSPRRTTVGPIPCRRQLRAVDDLVLRR